MLDDCGYDASAAWRVNKKVKFIEHILSSIFPVTKSLNKDLRIWGNQESNDIQVLVKDGNIESIQIRFDLRNDIDNFKSKIIDFSKSISCDFFIPSTKTIINPDVETLNKILNLSGPARFVRNQKQFLDEIADKTFKDYIDN